MGRIGRPHGIRGEVTLVPDSDDPDRFRPGAEFLTERGDVLVVTAVSPYRDRGLVLAFDGVTDRAGAERLRGTILTIAAGGRRPLGEGEFWPDDLVGLTALAADGRAYGTISAVEFGVGQDRLVVTTPGGSDVLVPFVDDLVDDPGDGSVVLRPPDGLFEAVE